MKYREILSFDPITEVIQIDNLKNSEYQQDLVRTFVYPEYFLATVIPQIVNQMKVGGRDQKGIQIIGNYGTGKSHLMSLVSLVAENADYLKLIHNNKAKEILHPIAGQFKVLRLEMGTDKSLWSTVSYYLQKFLNQNRVDYRFDANSNKMYREQLEDMLAAFEDKYPNHGLLVVIDEMLSYLQVRTNTGELANDLQVLQSLGQLCSDPRFAFMFGVQEKIYESKEFHFWAEYLLKVKDRYVDMTIRKEDVAFVVRNRLLRKDANQKAAIRSHLEKFMPLFSDMHDHLMEYVDLFPVHPAYFDNFQRIRIGKSQREVLRTLSAEFERIADQEIPTDNPGLISYDSYFAKMMSEVGNMAIPDFKTVADTVQLIHDKINSNFGGIRAKKAPLGKRIANAAAIKLLQGDLDHPNGARAEVLTDELCYTDPMADDHDLLVSIVDSTAKLIVKATSGQYFEQDETSSEYHLRTKGGVNFEQQIAEYAEGLSPLKKDEAFFRFLVEYLEIADNPYRSGFRIYTHQLEWRSHKITRDGYIFMGGANEKSTTQPRQSFYMVFMPIFQDDKKKRNEDGDEIYFMMDDLSDKFKDLVCKFGAAYLLMSSADSTQRIHYRVAYEAILKEASKVFTEQYLDRTKVFYGTDDPRILKTYSLPSAEAAPMDYFNRVASDTFEEQFTAEASNYPAFTMASQVITRQNRDHYIKSAKAKIIKPGDSNRDGEAVLTALQCFVQGQLSTNESIYAQSILDKLDNKGANKVLNKDEILAVVPNSDGRIWRSTDYLVDSDFEFLVLCALVVTGEIEITLANGSQINASNIEGIRNLAPEQYWAFTSIKRPKGLNLPVIKAVTKAFCGVDLSGRLDDPQTYAKLVASGKQLAADTARFIGSTLQNGAITVAGVELMSDGDVLSLRNNLQALKNFADKLATYTSAAKLKNMPWDTAAVNRMIEYLKSSRDVQALIAVGNSLEAKVNYLQQALQYAPSGSDLNNAMKVAIDRFWPVVDACGVGEENNAAIQNYTRELDDIKAKYIAWYLDLYYKYCLNDLDNADKTRLLNSDEYKALNRLVDLPLFNPAVLANLRSDIVKLKTADPNVQNMLQSSPYANFDPRNSRSGKSIRELTAEVKDMYADWVKAIQTFLAEPEQQESLRLMGDNGAIDFANRIINGMENISNENTARAVVEFITKLSSGFQRVEISQSELTALFNHPLSIGDANAAFERLILAKTHGKDHNKVRIILTSDNNNQE